MRNINALGRYAPRRPNAERQRTIWLTPVLWPITVKAAKIAHPTMLPSTMTAIVSQSPSLRTMPSAPRAQLIGAMFAPAQIHICCSPVESLSASGMGSMLWTSTLSSAPASVAMIAPWPPVGVRSRRVVRLEQRPARHLRGVAVGPTPRRARRHHYRRDTAPATETLSTRTARRTLRNLQTERREIGELRGPLGRGERSVGL